MQPRASPPCPLSLDLAHHTTSMISKPDAVFFTSIQETLVKNAETEANTSKFITLSGTVMGLQETQPIAHTDKRAPFKAQKCRFQPQENQDEKRVGINDLISRAVARLPLPYSFRQKTSTCKKHVNFGYLPGCKRHTNQPHTSSYHPSLKAARAFTTLPSLTGPCSPHYLHDIHA